MDRVLQKFTDVNRYTRKDVLYLFTSVNFCNALSIVLNLEKNHDGVGVLQLKETHIGSLLLVRSMGLKEEGGALAGLGRAMG